MRGISLPVNLIVIIAVVILVLAVVGMFFFSTSNTQFGALDAEETFSQGCTAFCRDPCSAAVSLNAGGAYGAGEIDEFHRLFGQACERLGHASDANTHEGAIACLNACGCETDCTENTGQPSIPV